MSICTSTKLTRMCQPDYPHPDDFAAEPECLICCGDGYLYGDEIDAEWDEYEPGELYACTSCGGSGFAKDMTWC